MVIYKGWVKHCRLGVLWNEGVSKSIWMGCMVAPLYRQPHMCAQLHNFHMNISTGLDSCSEAEKAGHLNESLVESGGIDSQERFLLYVMSALFALRMHCLGNEKMIKTITKSSL